MDAYPRSPRSRNGEWKAIQEERNANKRRYQIRANRFERSCAERDRRDERCSNDVSDTERRGPPALGLGSAPPGLGDESGRVFVRANPPRQRATPLFVATATRAR